MTDADTSAPSPFWHPRTGVRHHGFASPDPEQRASYITRLAASAGSMDEIWTNSPVLDWCQHYRPDISALLDVVAAIARARGRGDDIFRPVSAHPVLALILDLPDRLTDRDRDSIERVLTVGRWSGVSVTLVLPARPAGALAIVDPRRRAQPAALEPPGWPGGAVRELERGRI
jgi:hypothetical protein